MTIQNLELKELIYWLPSREGVCKQLRNGGGVLYAMFNERPFQTSNYYRFINAPLQQYNLPSQKRDKNPMPHNNRII
jgi:hypothetical protein